MCFVRASLLDSFSLMWAIEESSVHFVVPQTSIKHSHRSKRSSRVIRHVRVRQLNSSLLQHAETFDVFTTSVAFP